MSDAMTEEIIGAAIEVHRHLGPGLLEVVYEEALGIEFELRGIPFQRQVPLQLSYKGRPVKGQRIDLVVFGEVVLEVKSVLKTQDVFVATVLTYLTSTKLKRGLIINFGCKRLIDGVQRVSQ